MAWLYWFLGSAAYFYQFVFRTIFSTVGNEIAAKYQISVVDLSTFFSVGMLTYALMQVPGGMLLDRFGARRMLTSAMAMLSLGSILVGMSDNFTLGLLGRVLMGAGSAFAFLGTSKIVSMWFPLNMMGFLLGSTVFLGSMGGAFSKTIYEAFPDSWDFNYSLIMMGIGGVVLTAALFFLLKEKPTTSSHNTPRLSLFGGLRAVVSNKQILYSAFFMFFGYLPISILGDSWGPLAFEKIFSASAEIANQTILYFYIAFSIGALLYSAIASILNRPKEVLIFGYSLSIVFLYILLFQTGVGGATYWGIPGFLILSSLIAFNLGGVTLAFPIGCSHASKEVSATVVGVMNMLCMISGSIFSKIIGSLVDFYASVLNPLDGVGVAYIKALTPLVVTSLLAVAFLLLIREKEQEVSLS